MKKSLNTVSDLTNDMLDNSISNLITFWNYSFFEERGVDSPIAMVYALELLACTLNLVCLEELGEDGVTLLESLVTALHNRAQETKASGWDALVPALPYTRGLTTTQ